MKIFEQVMSNMTPEVLAELGVKLVSINNQRLYYITSTGQLFNTENYQEALQHEYNWLMSEVNTASTDQEKESVENSDENN